MVGFLITSCSDDVQDGPLSSKEILKENEVTVNSDEHVYEVRLKNETSFWGVNYQGIVGTDTIRKQINSSEAFYEEEWFKLEIPEDKRKIIVHVNPNLTEPKKERKVVIVVAQGNAFDRFTLIQK